MVLPPIAGFSYTGWFPDHVTNGVDYPWLVGLAVSGLVYFLASRTLDVSAERSAIEASERQLAALDAAVRPGSAPPGPAGRPGRPGGPGPA
jgi:hypothetical protein